MRAIKPLIECFFGRGGFKGRCPSNAGACLFGGRTIHNSIGLSATSSMKVEHLGLKGKTRTKVEKITVPAAALAIDEVSQMSATMLHANAVRHTYGRAREHGLRVDEYMKVNELFGRMPVVLLSGDYLQLPPVPESSSVLWPALGAAYEHRQGKALISSVPMVYEFRKSNRFTDERLIRLLAAMRTPGGQSLQNDDWEALVQRQIRLCRPRRAGSSVALKISHGYRALSLKILWTMIGPKFLGLEVC